MSNGVPTDLGKTPLREDSRLVSLKWEARARKKDPDCENESDCDFTNSYPSTRI